MTYTHRTAGQFWQDRRIGRTKWHQLLDILVIAVYGVICGADSWVEVAA